MATSAEWQAILDAIDAELLARAAGAKRFRERGPSGGELEVEDWPMSELLKHRTLAVRRLFAIGGGKPAEPARLGVDILTNTTNNDGV